MLALIANTPLSLDDLIARLQPLATPTRRHRGAGAELVELAARHLDAQLSIHRFEDVDELSSLFFEGERAADLALHVASGVSLWPRQLLVDYAETNSDPELREALERITTLLTATAEPGDDVEPRRDAAVIATRLMHTANDQLARFHEPFRVSELDAAGGLRLFRIQHGESSAESALYLVCEASYLGCLYFLGDDREQRAELAVACSRAIRFVPDELLQRVVRESATGNNRLTGALALALVEAGRRQLWSGASDADFDRLLARYDDEDELHRQVAARARSLLERAEHALAAQRAQRNPTP